MFKKPAKILNTP